MATLYMTIQGKGGIGKSFVSLLLAQYLRERNADVSIIDTDSVNPTLSQFKALNVQHLQLSREHIIDQRALDALIAHVDSAGDNASVVVDVGSSGFETLMLYQAENRIFDLLQARGHHVVLNTIIAGGPDAEETMKGAMAILNSTRVPTILWLNAHPGALEIDGNPIEDADFLNNKANRIIGTVVLHKRTEATFGKDVHMMLTKRLTFEEVMTSFDLMPMTRIKRIKEDVWTQLDDLALPRVSENPQAAAG